MTTPVVVGLVGPCTSGKSTVRTLLEVKGVEVRHIAQEHSFAPAMWKKIANPDVLVFLDVSYPETLRRRNWDWKQADYDEQQRRLAHARAHADLILHTDSYSPQEVATEILVFLDLDE